MSTTPLFSGQRLFISLLLITVSHLASAQEKKQNHIFAELGGSAILYSINYERYFGNHFTTRIGGSYLRFPGIPTLIRPAKIFTLPIFGNFLIGKPWFSVEAGAGGYLLGEIGGDKKFHPGILLGTRFEFKSGFIFRITYTPVYSHSKEKLVPWYGLSIGQRFSRL